MSRRTNAPAPAAPGRMPGIPSGEAAKAQLRRHDAKQLTEYGSIP